MKRYSANLALLLIALIILVAFIAILGIVRLFSEKQLDDVNPLIPCDAKLLEKADVLFVIPKFDNGSIAENKSWCNEILKMNKTLALHGVYHDYHEFSTDRDEDYIQEGINIFEKAFGFKPVRFKPPQLRISKNNKKLLREMKVDTWFNQLTHKVYHCNDSGKFHNWMIDVF